MAEEEQRHGLEVPDHTQRKKGDSKYASGAERAKVLEYLADHELVDPDELLRQIEIGSRDFINECSNHGTEMGAAVLCEGIASGLRGTLKGADNVHSLLLLGYLYGGLISPDPEAHNYLVEKQQARMVGSSKGGEKGRQMTRDKLDMLEIEIVKRAQEESPISKGDFDERMAEKFRVSPKTVERERLRIQKKSASGVRLKR